MASPVAPIAIGAVGSSFRFYGGGDLVLDAWCWVLDTGCWVDTGFIPLSVLCAAWSALRPKNFKEIQPKYTIQIFLCHLCWRL